MDIEYVLACGIVWRKTADPEAGWGLVECLESRDPELRLLAQTLLVESGESSMGLLENALASGVVNPDVAVPGIAEILRIRCAEKLTIQRVNENCIDATLRGESSELGAISCALGGEQSAIGKRLKWLAPEELGFAKTSVKGG